MIIHDGRQLLASTYCSVHYLIRSQFTLTITAWSLITLSGDLLAYLLICASASDPFIIHYVMWICYIKQLQQVAEKNKTWCNVFSMEQKIQVLQSSVSWFVLKILCFHRTASKYSAGKYNPDSTRLSTYVIEAWAAVTTASLLWLYNLLLVSMWNDKYKIKWRNVQF